MHGSGTDVDSSEDDDGDEEQGEGGRARCSSGCFRAHWGAFAVVSATTISLFYYMDNSHNVRSEAKHARLAGQIASLEFKMDRRDGVKLDVTEELTEENIG